MSRRNLGGWGVFWVFLGGWGDVNRIQSIHIPLLVFAVAFDYVVMSKNALG